MTIRLLIIQYAGDYREAFKRFESGEEETYYNQRFDVDFVAKLAEKLDEVATLCFITKERYNEKLNNKVRAIGAGFGNKIKTKELIKIIENYDPTHLIIRTPDRATLNWAIQRKVKTLVILADSFSSKGLRGKIRNFFLAISLNNEQIDWIGNHGLNASESLVDIGVKSDKVIPYDWHHQNTPERFPSKSLPNKRDWEIIYVGAVTESKGVGDVLNAVKILISKGISVNFKIVGKGDLETYTKRAHELNISNNIALLGLVPNKHILPLMQAADVVVIPSRHEYPEGLPLTIYEALCSRTPIVASNHPMFCNKLIHHITALIFQSGDSTGLAHCIEELISSSSLYQSLSQNSLNAWNSLQIPVTWDQMINYWLLNSKEGNKWLFDNCLSVVQNQPLTLNKSY